jgi:hypothetical protein
MPQEVRAEQGEALPPVRRRTSLQAERSLQLGEEAGGILRMPKEKSDFAHGLVINLVKFAEHFWNRERQEITAVKTWYELSKKDRELFLSSKPPSHLDFGEALRRQVRNFLDSPIIISHGIDHKIASLIESWANGASDHLYDMFFPARFKNEELNSKINKLRKKGLEMGHGFTGKKWTFSDINELEKLTEEIAVQIDRDILKIKDADIGEY